MLLKNLLIKINSGFRLLSNSLLYLHLENLQGIPDLPTFQFTIRTMDYNNDSDVELWIQIMKDSFQRESVNKKVFIQSIIEHPYYDVLDTFLLMDEEKPVAIISAARFQKNKKIGVTHYLGVDPQYKGKKIGKYLILFVLHYLKNNGFEKCEAESYLAYHISLGIHFQYGFKPKLKKDFWNTDDNSWKISKYLTNRKLIRLYKKFLLKK